METGDGSFTLSLEGLNEQYHSKHGALQEAIHVFIEAGLQEFSERKEGVRILEVGFGTGLNTWLSFRHAASHKLPIHYIGLEPFPLDWSLVEALSYTEVPGEVELLQQLHACSWNEWHEITPLCSLKKVEKKLEDWEGEGVVDLVYYDAFGPRAQGEMWEKEVLQKTAAMLAPGGVFVTYCAKGSLKRDLRDAGLEVESLPGPPGKREMVRARKPA